MQTMSGLLAEILLSVKILKSYNSLYSSLSKQAVVGVATTVQIEENHIEHKDSNELPKLLHHGGLSRWIEQ